MPLNSDRLKREIIKTGLSFRQVAELAGCSHVNISMLCNGKSQWSKHLPAIARVIGVRLDELDSNYAQVSLKPIPSAPASEYLDQEEIISSLNYAIGQLAEGCSHATAIALLAQLIQEIES